MKRVFDTKAAFKAIDNTTAGPERTEAYLKAIQMADISGDVYARLRMRASMAIMVPFWDDTVKVLPVCTEYFALAEEYPEVADIDDIFMTALEAARQSLLLPQLELPVCEKMLKKMEESAYILKRGAVKKSHMLCTEFYTYIDLQKAEEHYNIFNEEKGGMHSACNACDEHLRVWYNMQKGDTELAYKLARKIFNGMECHDIPWQTYAIFLEHYMDIGKVDEHKKFIEKLIRGGCRDASDLANVGTVLRCLAHTNPSRGLKFLQKYWRYSINLWNQHALYFFYKGAWRCCEALYGKGLLLYPPEGFKGDTNSSSPAYFAQWFHNEAVKIAESFDKRNGTDFYMKDLSRAYL